MSPDIPSPYAALLLALAAYRLWRLIAEDDVFDRPRRWLLRLGDWRDGQAAPPAYRDRLAEFITCPWCLGFWLAVAWWVAWLGLEEWALFAAVPFALSAVVAGANAVVGFLTE